MLARIAASLQWLGVFAHSILVFARKLFGVCGEGRKLIVDNVLVMSCYYSKEPIANIVGLVPPVEVMHGEPKGKGKGKPKIETTGLLHRIRDLPPNWWVQAENGQHNYNHRTTVKIAKQTVVALLDGGSGINSVTEEMLVGMLNKCWAEKIPVIVKHGR